MLETVLSHLKFETGLILIDARKANIPLSNNKYFKTNLNHELQELQASPVEGQSLQQKIKKKKRNGQKEKKKEKAFRRGS